MKKYSLFIPMFFVVIFALTDCDLDPKPPEFKPVACFTATPEICEAGDCQVQFDASCSEHAVNYQWDFDGDGVVDTEGSDKQVVEHTYVTAGTFPPELTVENEEGDKSSFTKQITVSGSSSPCELRLYQGHNQSGFLNQALPDKVRVRLVDGLNEPKSGIQVNFAILTGGGTITQADITDGEGVAETIWELGNECGEQKIKAWVEEGCLTEILEISAFGDKISYGGKEYPVVIIGGKCWMAKNLNYATLYSWLYPAEDYPNDIPYAPDSYGRLYTWDAARTACPGGWHLPSKGEWDNMIQEFDATWNTNDIDYTSAEPYDDLINDGPSGFDALLGGYRSPSGSFDFLGWYGFYWSGTEEGTQDAWNYDFGSKLTRTYWDKSGGHSCRCIQD